MIPCKLIGYLIAILQKFVKTASLSHDSSFFNQKETSMEYTKLSNWGRWTNECNGHTNQNCYGEHRVRTCPSNVKVCNKSEIIEYRSCTENKCRNGTISHMRYKLGKNKSWSIIANCESAEDRKYSLIFAKNPNLG
mgnify:CR=1 FL=1